MAGIISPSGGSSTQRYGKGADCAGGIVSSGIAGLRIAAAVVEKPEPDGTGMTGIQK